MYTQDSLKQSDYEGWVVWLDGKAVINPDGTLLGYDECTPILEHVPHNYKLASLATGFKDRDTRSASRNTMEWHELPHSKIVMLEVYAFRDVYKNQPLISIMKQPNRDVRFIQYKKGGLIANTARTSRILPSKELEHLPGQSRLGINSWVVGYWDRTAGQSEIWEIPARGGKWPDKLEVQGRNHPCWPRPWGFGLSPKVLGLTESEIPAPPML